MSAFIQKVRRLGAMTSGWREDCPDQNTWYFWKAGKHSITYATVDWSNHTVTFARRRK